MSVCRETWFFSVLQYPSSRQLNLRDREVYNLWSALLFLCTLQSQMKGWPEKRPSLIHAKVQVKQGNLHFKSKEKIATSLTWSFLWKALSFSHFVVSQDILPHFLSNHHDRKTAVGKIERSTVVVHYFFKSNSCESTTFLSVFTTKRKALSFESIGRS